MLSELYIHNFAIIDDLRMQFNAGFNVLTGETGAGKSIILDAVSLILGDRADTSMIRAGCPEAFVEATFEINKVVQEMVAPLLTAEGLDSEQDDTVVLAREIRANGRSIARVNGRVANLGMLRQIAVPLIDVHGQGDHLSLLKPRSHLPLLDSYAGLASECASLAHEVGRLHLLQRELQELRRDESLLARRIDMLQFQIQEIDAANLKDGEDQELREERARLANAEQLMKSASEAIALLIGVDDDDRRSIIDNMGHVEIALSQLARFDTSQASRVEEMQGLVFQLNEMAADLQKYLDDLEFNPQRLDYVEERLELISVLKRKYGESIGAVLAFRDKAEAELTKISNSEERIVELEAEQDQYLRRIGKSAAALSKKRKAAALELSAAVEGQLADLHMEGTRFQVEFSTQTATDGVYVALNGVDHRLSFDKSGIDQVEFMISANPGEPLKPLAKVASGGETARLMLALKTALSQVDAAPTLIFDEIDQGIGGRVGDVAGRKLWGLAATSQHQVIVVTHLPQIAGYGDRHFHVSKQEKEGRTITSVVNLDGPGRITELAAMLGTLGEHATGGAESILQLANAIKRSARS